MVAALSALIALAVALSLPVHPRSGTGRVINLNTAGGGPVKMSATEPTAGMPGTASDNTAGGGPG